MTLLKHPLFQVIVMFTLMSMSISAVANSFSFKKLEASSGGHLGVYALDTANNTVVQYHAAKRFPMDSTFKAILVAAILKQSMSNSGLLKQIIIYNKTDLAKSAWHPVTEKHLATGMTISDLCAAAVSQSDSTAANLLMKKLGGPNAVTAFARLIGDNKFRLDRWEPELNTGIPGDPRDTTTPMAMTKSLEKLVFGNVLGLSQRKQLQAWLKATTTGGERIRAGVPQDWIVGDKTGTGDYGTTNDIGIIWPHHCSPIALAIYFTQDKKDAQPRNDVIAAAMRIALKKLAQKDQCFSKDLK